MTFAREILEVDVLFVGAGPASLVGALHLLSLLASNAQIEPSIAIMQKGLEVHSHPLSGTYSFHARSGYRKGRHGEGKLHTRR